MISQPSLYNANGTKDGKIFIQDSSKAETTLCLDFAAAMLLGLCPYFSFSPAPIIKEPSKQTGKETERSRSLH